MNVVIFQVLVALSLLAPRPLDDVLFDTTRHLSGYDTALFSEYSDLYDLAKFRKLEGKAVSPERLEKVQKEWRDHRDRVLLEVRRFERDPVARFGYHVDRALPKYPLLARSDFVKVETFRPFILYIQKHKQGRNFVEIVERQYGPILHALAGRFDDLYTRPFHLERKEGYGGNAVFILSSRKEYTTFTKTVAMEGLYWGNANYLPELRMTVTYFRAPTDSNYGAHTHSVLHEAVHSLLDAYWATTSRHEKDNWFTEGIAEYLATHRLEPGKEIELCRFDEPYLRLIIDKIQDPAAHGDLIFYSLGDLASARGYGSLLQKFTKITGQKREEVRKKLGYSILLSFCRQSGLFMHFLHHGEDQKYREMALGWVKGILSGIESTQAFTLAFGSSDPRLLEAPFLAYLDRMMKDSGIGPADRDLDLAGTLALQLSKGAGPAPPRPISTFKPESLLPPVGDGAHLLASMVSGAAGGNLGGALRMGQREVMLVQGKARERIERENQRLALLVDTRREVLESWKRTGKNLSIQVGKRKITGSIQKLDDSILLKTYRGGVELVPLEAFDAGQLARWVIRKGVTVGEEWVLAYAILLNGDPAQAKKRLSKEPSDAARQLAEDLEEYAGLIASGEAWAEIEELSKLGIPKTVAQADRVLDSIDGLLSRHSAASPVRDRGAPLREYAKAALDQKRDSLDLADLLRGRVERMKEGRIRVHYSFQNPLSIEDFIEIEEPRHLGEGMNLPDLPIEASTVSHEDKALRFEGIVARHHILELEAPFSIEYAVLFEDPGTEVVEPFFIVGVGLDDSWKHCGSLNLGDIRLYDKEARRNLLQENGLGSFLPDTKYVVKLDHDGDSLAVAVDGESRDRVDAARMKEGKIFLYQRSETASLISSFTLEGKPKASSVERLKDRWVARELDSRFRSIEPER